jgi:hypothetical protein
MPRSNYTDLVENRPRYSNCFVYGFDSCDQEYVEEYMKDIFDDDDLYYHVTLPRDIAVRKQILKECRNYTQNWNY